MICPTCAHAADQLTKTLTTGAAPEHAWDADTARKNAAAAHCGRHDCSCQHRTETAGLEQPWGRP